MWKRTARAAVIYWDPQGTTGSNPYTNNLSGFWEAPSWSTTNTGQAVPQVWPVSSPEPAEAALSPPDVCGEEASPDVDEAGAAHRLDHREPASASDG